MKGLIAITLLSLASPIHAAGYEEVEITHVRNSTQLSCPASSTSQGNVSTQTSPRAPFSGSQNGSSPGNSSQGSTSASPQHGTPGELPGAAMGGSGRSSVHSQDAIPRDPTKQGCWNALIYIVTYKRYGGGGGEVVMKSYPVARRTRLYFCPGAQGQPERPC